MTGLGISTDTEMKFVDLILLATGIFTISWMVSVLVFIEVSGNYLERKMKQDALNQARWDRGIGTRYNMYAMVLVANTAAKVSPIDDQAVLKYARKVDRVLAFWTVISFIGAMFFCVFFYFLSN